MNLKIYLILVFGCIVFDSCTKTKEENNTSTLNKELQTKENISSAGEKESGVEFNVEYIKPRRIYKIEKQDLNNDGNKEIIVLSVAKDTAEKYNDYYNFDLLEVFALNSEKKRFIKILSDTVDYSTECKFEDLAKDSNKQIIVETFSGGNDAIASKGMFIYNMTSPEQIELLKYFDSGDPQIEDLNKDSAMAILVSDEFWGVMPQVNVISFVKEIYKLENDKLVVNNSEYGKFYEDKIIDLKEKYYGVKRKVEMGMQMGDMSYPLYREAAEVIVNYYAKEDISGLKKFWDEEKDTLEKNISYEEFTDLSNFVNKVLSSAKNA